MLTRISNKKHFRSFSIYAFTVFFNAAISFVSISILTHYLSESDYGIINLYSSTLIFLSPFIAVGVQFILGVDFFKMNEKNFSTHFTNALVVPLFLTIAFTLLIFTLHFYVENFLHINFFFALIIPFVCFLTIYNDVILTLIRDKGLHRLFSIYSISKNLIEIAFTVGFVILLRWQWQGRLASSVLALTFMAIVIIFLIRKWKLYTGHFDVGTVRKNFIMGLPFVPERLAIFILGYSDRFFINYYKGTGDVGLYSSGAQVAIIVNLGILTLSNVFYPSIYRSLSDAEIDTVKLRKIILSYIGIAAFIAIMVILATPFLFKYFIGPRFTNGRQYAIFLTVGLFFWAIYNVFVAFLLNRKSNKLIMSISIFGMALSICLNFLLVGHYGALGATYTSMVVYFFMAMTTIFFVNKNHPLQDILLKRRKNIPVL